MHSFIIKIGKVFLSLGRIVILISILFSLLNYIYYVFNGWFHSDCISDTEHSNKVIFFSLIKAGFLFWITGLLIISNKISTNK